MRHRRRCGRRRRRIPRCSRRFRSRPKQARPVGRDRRCRPVSGTRASSMLGQSFGPGPLKSSKAACSHMREDEEARHVRRFSPVKMGRRAVKPGAGARLLTCESWVLPSLTLHERAGSRRSRPRQSPVSRAARWWRRRAGRRRLFDLYAARGAGRSPRRSRRRRRPRRGAMPTGRSRRPGFGVAEHKEIKNRLCSTGLFEHYRERQLHRLPRSTRQRKIVEIPQAGRRDLRADAVHQSGLLRCSTRRSSRS